MRFLFLLTIGVAAFLASARFGSAQTPAATPEEATRANFPVWTAELPGGKFVVALRAILSVSSHEYVVDGAARVTEVNVATSSNLLARFYVLEPITPEAPGGIGQSAVNMVMEKFQDISTRTGQGEVWQKVVKNYPASTHAHTVEYRLENAEELSKLFKSVEDAWKRNRSATYRGKDD
jgi:hypothetical protein